MNLVKVACIVATGVCLGSASVLVGQTTEARVELPAQGAVLSWTGKSLVTSTSPGLSSRLAEVVAAFAERGAQWAQVVNVRGLPLDGPMHIRIEIRTDPAASTGVRRSLESLGVDIRYENGPGLIEATAPVAVLADLESIINVRTVSPARFAVTTVGNSTTQGVAAANAITAFGAGIDGSGVTVAVIDNFNTSSATLQASGDWPSDIVLVDVDGSGFGSAASAHGMATVEIAYDMAPGADFRAYEVRTLGDWYDAIGQAVTDGADVISMSLSAPLDGIGDGTAMPGSIAEAVANARAAGVLVVKSAGNNRIRHWGGFYSNDTLANNTHNWGLGSNVNLLISCMPTGARITGELFWDDWSLPVDHNYDLFLLEVDAGDSTLTVRAASTVLQTGLAGQTPQEFVSYVVVNPDSALGCPSGTGAFGFAIGRTAAATDRNLQLFAATTLQVSVAGRSLGFPAESPNLIAVGAIDVSSLVQEASSSEGPVLAPGGGIPAGSTNGMKPDVASFANVDTESYGPGVFNGTSSATPHVAGLAALMLQKDSTLVVDSLMAKIRAWAAKNDLGTPGFDNQYGHGKAAFHPDTLYFAGKIFLEGPFSAGSMSTSVPFANVLPLTQPYRDPVFDGAVVEYGDSLTVSGFPTNTIDWVLVSLRDASTNTVHQQVGFVLSDGSIVDTAGAVLAFPCVSPDSFYVVVGHRNHQAVMSSSKVAFATSTGTWDFTTAMAQGYTTSGFPMKDLDGVRFGLFAGNGVPDKQTTAPDFNVWLVDTKAVTTGYLQSDYDLDGQVTASDFNVWLTNTKAVAACQVP